MRRIWLLAPLTALLWAVGCGSQSEPDSNTQIEPTGSTPDVDAADLADADAARGDAATNNDSSARACGPNFEDLGVLGVGDADTLLRQLEARPADLADGEAAGCAEQASGAGSHTFGFGVDEPAILQVALASAAADAPVFELRRALCKRRQAAVYCSQQASYRAVVSPDTLYFLRVDGAADSADEPFQLSYELQPMACTPGTDTCTDGSLDHCVRGTSTEAYRCADGCAGSGACGGDQCSTAISVGPTAGSPAQVAGDRQAYTDRFDAEALDGCELPSGLPTGATRGPEIFMKLSDLQAGQVITVDNTAATGSYIFYVLDGCQATRCAGAQFVDDNGDNRLEWTVPADGDYVVVAEATSDVGRPFAFDVAAR